MCKALGYEVEELNNTEIDGKVKVKKQ